MHLSAVFVAAAAAAAASASPTPARRACGLQYPEALGFPISFDITSGSPAAISFEIPPGASGPCSLVTQFPAGYPIAATGNPLVNFVALDGPAAGAVVGTTTLGPNPWNADGLTTINSFDCSAVLSFQMEIAEGEGSVAFHEVEGAGIMMTYGC